MLSVYCEDESECQDGSGLRRSTCGGAPRDCSERHSAASELPCDVWKLCVSAFALGPNSVPRQSVERSAMNENVRGLRFRT